MGVPYYYLYMFLFTKLCCYVDIGDYYVFGDGRVVFQGVLCFKDSLCSVVGLLGISKLQMSVISCMLGFTVFWYLVVF